MLRRAYVNTALTDPELATSDSAAPPAGTRRETHSARTTQKNAAPAIPRRPHPSLNVAHDTNLRELSNAWLAVIAAETDPSNFTVNLAASVAASDPGPVLQRQIDGTWRAGRYIGELRRDGRTLEIRPRLDVAVIAEWASPDRA